MAVIETWFKQDLQKPVKVNAFGGNFFSEDNLANKIGILVYDGGEEATLAGTVTANVIRADGSTVAVTGGQISGNGASVILPQAAYAVPGMMSVIIKLTNGNTVTTLGAVAGVCYRSATDATVDPGTIIPSVQALIAQIQAAIAQIPADYSELEAAVAELQDDVERIEPEALSAFMTNTFGPTDILTIDDGADNVPVKSLSVELEPGQDLHGYDSPWVGGAGKNLLSGLEQGGINGNTGTDGEGATANRLRSIDPVSVTTGQTYTISMQTASDKTLQLGVSFYPAIGEQRIVNSGWQTSPYAVQAPADATVMVILVRFSDDSDIVPSDVYNVQMELGTTATAYEPYENICPITGHTGVTITRTGKNLFNPNAGWTNGVIADDGTPSTAGSSKYSGIIYGILPGTQYTLQGTICESGKSFRIYYRTKTGEWIRRTSSLGTTPYTFTTPENCGGIQLQIHRDYTNPADIQLELGSTATEFEQYQGQSISVNLASAAGGTVYGGTVDPVLGVLTVTDAEIASYDGETLPGEWISDRDAYAEGTTPTSGAQVVYKLTTPITYQLTPAEITTLLGYNTVYTDAGEFTLTYRQDAELAVNGKISGGISGKADKRDTVLETTLSRGRKSGTDVGSGSFAFGNNVEASGAYSYAEGQNCSATAPYSHAQGFYTIANHQAQHVFGYLNIPDDSTNQPGMKGKYVEIVGNGQGRTEDDRSNARTLDWNGNEKIAGSITLGLGTSDEVTLTAAQLKQLLELIS